MNIGKKIKDARLSLNMTQEDLAKRIGVSKNAISNYENGVSTPKLELLCAIMKHLEVDANYLYDVSHTPDPVKLSPREKQIIIEYRKLTQVEKKRFDMMLGLEAEPVPQSKHA